jgi:hypothetical protein
MSGELDRASLHCLILWLQKGCDTLGMSGELDRASLQSEDTESVHSMAENLEPVMVDEIVNPQGVRFTPHHHTKEGNCWVLGTL